MNHNAETRRTSEFDGKRHDGRSKTRESRSHAHFTSVNKLRKRLLAWLHSGRD